MSPDYQADGSGRQPWVSYQLSPGPLAYPSGNTIWRELVEQMYWGSRCLSTLPEWERLEMASGVVFSTPKLPILTLSSLGKMQGHYFKVNKWVSIQAEAREEIGPIQAWSLETSATSQAHLGLMLPHLKSAPSWQHTRQSTIISTMACQPEDKVTFSNLLLSFFALN